MDASSPSTRPVDTVKLAHFAFADLPAYGKDGTFTSADRRIGRLSRAGKRRATSATAWNSAHVRQAPPPPASASQRTLPAPTPRP
jgi:hypothetical protein